ncbi:MAG: diadenylate cyclase CdaA [Suipraeoptans sp.]
MVDIINKWITNIFGSNVYLPSIHAIDVIEIIVLTVLIYIILKWINNTKAWMLLKGILVLAVFVLIAFILQMHTILYLVSNSVTVLATAVIVVFQPELRRALEKLGEKQFISSVVPFDTNQSKVRFSEDTKEELVSAAFEMGKYKTGALIVVEQAIKLTEYESTGIPIDALVSKQLILNIFEHNTPLHDGAVIMRGDRIVAATCYLPLSDNMGISKDLGTRHRAALGLSEVSDAIVVIVSEETGNVSFAQGGMLQRNVDASQLTDKLTIIQEKTSGESRFRIIINKIKGRLRNERKTSE